LSTRRGRPDGTRSIGNSLGLAAQMIASVLYVWRGYLTNYRGRSCRLTSSDGEPFSRSDQGSAATMRWTRRKRH